MKKTFFIVASILLLCACKGQKQEKYASFQFKSVQAQADSLKKLYTIALNPGIENRAEIERALFSCFPNTFAEMQALFGYDKIAGPLYFYIPIEGPIPFFRDLNSIPKDIYYNKYIDICVGGYWQADHINEAFGIAKRIENDTQAICSELIKRTDEEILSVFRFIFDGPHPADKENKKDYNFLLSKLKNTNYRLAELLSESYIDLLSEKHHH